MTLDKLETLAIGALPSEPFLALITCVRAAKKMRNAPTLDEENVATEEFDAACAKLDAL